MKKGCFLLLLLAACGNRSTQEEQGPNLSTADSTIIRHAPDTGPLTDTDDYNKPSAEDIALDSPLGAPRGRDTLYGSPGSGDVKER